MTLPAGARLGKVEILSPLGAGGMGEVYRARDLRLKRDIAVKVLPAMTASDADRLARFRREAEMLATLNHPNIAAIYGFEDEGGTHALLLELIEGPTLADRLRQGPIPVSDALAIARQISDALDAALERGIIHRDLKPANIKVRDDGVVKVLDFGLAKDGQWLGFAAGGFIRKVPIQGGAPQNIAKVDHVLLSASWSDDGSIVFNGWQSQLFRVSANGGTPEPLTSLDPQTGEWHQAPYCLPGAGAVLFTVSRRGRPPTVELVDNDLARNARLRLSVTGSISRPIWSHDGKSITFQKDLSLYSMAADDSRGPEVLLARNASANALFPLSWSRDGSTLVYSRPAPATNRDVFTLSAGREPAPFLVTPRDERSAMFSPDKRWMVYAALETGREEEVYVERYPGPGERVVVSVGGGREPVWSPLGEEIFYRSPDGQRMLAVTVRTEPSLSIGRPRTVFQGSFRPGLFWANYDVHPKTGEFVMLAVDEPLQPRLTVARNWTRLLSQR